MKNYKKIISISAVVTLIVFWLIWSTLDYNNKEYYYNRDKTKCFTVWHKKGGDVYFIPGKYTSLFLPDEEYLMSDNRNVFLIVWNNPPYYATITWRNNYAVKVKMNQDKFLILARDNDSDMEVYKNLFMTKDYRMKKGLDYFEWER